MDTRPTPPPPQKPADVIVPSQPAPRRKRWGLRVLAALGVLLVVAVLAHVIWGESEKRRLAAQLAAYRGAGEPVTVEELNRWPDTTSGSGENALPGLRAAGAKVDDKSDVYRAYLQADALLPLTDAEVAAYEAVLKENPDALVAIDEASAKTRFDWELAIVSPMIQNLDSSNDLTALRRLSNVLQADAMLARQRGDDARALRRVGQILFISRAAGHHPTLIGYLVSVGMSAQAAGVAAEILPDLSLADPEARRLAVALVTEFLDERSLADARRRGLMGERVLQLDTVSSLTQAKLSPGGVPGFRMASGGGGGPGLSVLGKLLRPTFFENGRVMAGHMTSMLRAVDQSPDWPTYQRKAPPSPKEGRMLARNLLVQIMLPSLDRAVMVYYRNAGERRLAATCLAAKLYAADHDGKLPGSLGDLVPTYLPSVPLDPFAAGGKTLAYVNDSADADDPRVYGVGENGVDNAGVEPDKRLPRREYDKLSDEIRHLNRQPRPKPVEFEESYPGPFPGDPPPGYPGAPPGFPGSVPDGGPPVPPPDDPEPETTPRDSDAAAPDAPR
jgi:hypothetical protein